MAVWPPGVARNCTGVHGAVLAWASVMKLEGRAHTWRFRGQAAQGIPIAVKLRALHSLHFASPEGADSVHPSRQGRRLGGGGSVVDGSTCPFIGSWCSLVWERRTTCWVTMHSQIPTYLSFGVRPLTARGGTSITMCRPAVRVRGHAEGGGVPGLLAVRPQFCWGGGVVTGLVPCFLVPKGNQPTACTLALWWLKFGPTGGPEGGWGVRKGPPNKLFGSPTCPVPGPQQWVRALPTRTQQT